MRIERVKTARCQGGEGPLWDVEEQALYFIDNTGRTAYRFHPATEQTRAWPMPAVITAFALRRRGGAVVTLRTGIHTLDLETGALEVISALSAEPPHVFNDAKVDDRGRFFMGASTPQIANPTNEGGLFRLDADQTLVRLDDDIHFSNGPCWSPDAHLFYFADSWRKTIYVYDYNLATGSVAGRRPFAVTEELGGLPDGATVDADGLLWTAIYGAGKLAAFRPDGSLERAIDMPVRYPSSVMFGGSDLDRLYVTTVRHDEPGRAEEADGGCVFVVEGLGARGRPEPRYAG